MVIVALLTSATKSVQSDISWLIHPLSPSSLPNLPLARSRPWRRRSQPLPPAPLWAAALPSAIRTSPPPTHPHRGCEPAAGGRGAARPQLRPHRLRFARCSVCPSAAHSTPASSLLWRPNAVMRYLGAPAQADPSGAARAPASPLVPLPCPCRAGDAPPVPLGRANVLQVPASSQALPAAGIPGHLWWALTNEYRLLHIPLKMIWILCSRVHSYASDAGCNLWFTILNGAYAASVATESAA